MSAYTKTFNDLTDVILTECDICSVYGKRFHTDEAMWDTGSQYTFLSRRIIEALQLKPSGIAYVSGIGGNSEANVYVVHVVLPSGDAVVNVEALDADYSDYDVIIGMDIIMLGEFHFDRVETVVYSLSTIRFSNLLIFPIGRA